MERRQKQLQQDSDLFYCFDNQVIVHVDSLDGNYVAEGLIERPFSNDHFVTINRERYPLMNYIVYFYEA
ncbi:hypothetical protein [Paenibacillus polymyxa]|uniref:hypothetical protein n=1 Tax=Paenibacillus polymyxa TaxID=1406 RepID=UPI001ABB15B2|nr:hypothetical protein [Paenibacillus polymyxa]MBO3284741.1 hypothetical protein [Paenibacillus polymyxa]